MKPLACVFSALLVIAAPASGQSTAPISTESSSARLSADQIRSIVGSLADAAEARYVDPAGGTKMARALRSNLAKGRYSAFSDPVELAARLTGDLYATVPDIHLRVVHEPNRSAQTVGPRSAGQPQGAGPRPFGRIDPRSSEAIARTNFGFEAVERLDGNIGYLKLSQFVPPEMSEPTARAAMQFLASSDAMIIDLRGNIGGSPELVRFILSHFTPSQPVPLMTRYMRDEDRTETMMSLSDIAGKRREGTPLYVLIDRNSASSAEMFAYLVQQKKLGTVYGATSSGAGQGGNMLPVGFGLSAFIPFTRITDGPGWEGKGIRPDVEVAPAEARGAAHLAALKALVEKAGDPEVRREREWALELVEAASRPASQSMDLAGFEGQFGTRAFKAKDGTLFVVGPTGREDPLVRIGDGIFRSRNGRFTFTAAAGQPASSLLIETLSGTRSQVARDGMEPASVRADTAGRIR